MAHTAVLLSELPAHTARVIGLFKSARTVAVVKLQRSADFLDTVGIVIQFDFHSLVTAFYIVHSWALLSQLTNQFFIVSHFLLLYRKLTFVL